MKNIKKWNYLYYVLSLIPAAFLFHFYEYGQHLKREEPRLLLVGFIAYIVITGLLAIFIKKRYVLLFQFISFVLSFVLARLFIEDDGSWFIPFGLDVAIIFTSLIVYAGQWFFRIFKKREEVSDKKE